MDGKSNAIPVIRTENTVRIMENVLYIIVIIFSCHLTLIYANTKLAKKNATKISGMNDISLEDQFGSIWFMYFKKLSKTVNSKREI